jgi:Ca2+-binding RTX toxin-like protein
MENGNYGISNINTTPTVAFNDVYMNTAGNYDGVTIGPGSISDDPKFVDEANDNFHLLFDSPAIDSGNSPNTPPDDIDDDSRLQLAGYDIGVDEFSGIIQCGGQDATIIGTAGDNVIIGTDGDDVIIGLGGNDIIYGLDGKDRICGGDGDDTIYGGLSVDRLWGDVGNDVLRGEGGRDILIGGGGNDTMDGGGGNDTLKGRSGNDTLFGAVGDDELIGNDGLDVCDGGNHTMGDTADDTCEAMVNVEF